jgi:hypothetical protein
MNEAARTQYLLGIAASAPERRVDPCGPARHNILKAAFEEIEDKTDWKNPINALVIVQEYDTIGLGVYLDAIEYFVGTKPEVFLVHSNASGTISTFRIASEGYRLSGHHCTDTLSW